LKISHAIVKINAREPHYTHSITCVNKIKNQGLLIKIGKIEYDKQYNEQHKDHIKKHQNTVIYCKCGCSYTRSNKLKHERTNKHKEYVEKKLYYDIRRGLNIIKKLDIFLNKIAKIK
jgi:hypothetical protein